MEKSILGIFPALTTPFVDGDLSLSGLKSNIEKFNKTGLSGYLILGSTGEVVLMNETERLKAIETVRSSAGEGMIVIAGTGAQSTRGTIDFTNQAARAGAHYALVVTPFYYKAQMTAQALEAYYRDVADHSKMPLILYNVPKFTGIDLPVESIVALADHPNIAGLKESSANITFLSEILKSVPKGFVVLQGSGSVLFPSLALGAMGGILALSNMAPKETVEIYRLAQEGEWKRAREIQMQILPVNQKIFAKYGVAGIKCALDLLGYIGGDPRPPLRPVPEEVKGIIKGVLQESGLL